MKLHLLMITFFCLILVQGYPETLLRLEDSASVASIVKDDQVKCSGKDSLRISVPGPSVLCIYTVNDLKEEDCTLNYTARVKTGDFSGTVHLEMVCKVNGFDYFSKGLNSTVRDVQDWKMLTTPFFLRKGDVCTGMVLNIAINGKGTVWIDDVLLTKESVKGK